MEKMNEFNNELPNTAGVLTSTSIDNLTFSYLRGEITFQQYEALIENQHFRNELALSQDQSRLIGNVVEVGESEDVQPPVGKKVPGEKKIKDRFLNFKSIVEADANTAGKDEDEDEEDEEDFIDNYDDTSQWNDFDIETLNFDKFIKDHQVKETSTSATMKEDEKASTSSKRKRADEKQTDDPMELKAKRRRNRVLPIEIQGLMGEANLAYARGETNKAIDACLEVIKYAPKASEPFQLLALLYSEIGQNDKALKVGLIAAQLNKDPDEWIQLIQQAIIEGDVELVLFCYNNAIQCNPKNIQLHLERVRLLEEKKDTRRLILAKLMLLKYADVNTDLEVYEKYLNQLLNELNNDTDRNKKIYVLKNDMKKFQDKFLTERLRLLVQLMIDQRSYKEPLMIIISQCHVNVKKRDSECSSHSDDNQLDQQSLDVFQSFQHLNDYKFEMPPECNNYIRAQFIVCLINLDYKYEEELIADMLSNDVEHCSSEFLLIADTYYGRKNYCKAKNFYYLLLTNVKEFLVQLDIWLKYGNCCNFLHEIEEAINAYRNAVSLDNSNCEAALSLVGILKKNSLLFEATNVIRKTLSSKTSKPLSTQIINLMINECLIQHEQENYETFIVNSRNLLFGCFKFVLEPENIKTLMKADSKSQRAISFHQILEQNAYELEFSFNKLQVATQNLIFDIYLKLFKVLILLKRHDELLTYAMAATVLPLVYERNDWNKSINFTGLIACILKSDGKNAFNILRNFIVEFKSSNKLWSYVGIVIGLCPSLSQQKFFIRLGAKHMDDLPLCMINAHFAIMSGTYRYALVEYMNCFEQSPFDPFINLIISITYCHISCQKYNTKRHLLVSQSLVFLRRYIKFRGVCQETYYNVARVMHQLSLFDLAAHFYQKCLDLPCTFDNQKEIYDLSRFAAYNLINIYKHAGNFQLARIVMRKYLTI